jgi:hypothetical protein
MSNINRTLDLMREGSGLIILIVAKTTTIGRSFDGQRMLEEEEVLEFALAQHSLRNLRSSRFRQLVRLLEPSL